MNPSACAVLAQIFPLLLVVVVLEARLVRKSPSIAVLFSATSTVLACLTGMVTAVIGVAVDGLNRFGALIVWMAFFLTVVMLGAAMFRVLLNQSVGDD